MERNVVLHHKEKLVRSIPEISNYIQLFQSINKRWGGAITAGMIETDRMEANASRLFGPLIQDMRSTKTKYGDIQEQLVDAIILEMFKKVIFEMTDAAKFTINILKRNLFERTADVGYLATDTEIVDFLKLAGQDTDPDHLAQRKAFVQARMSEYQYEYTVYNEIIILDIQGRVMANLDQNNLITRSNDRLLAQTQAIDLHSSNDTDKYLETFRTSDLRSDHGNILIYSQKIEVPQNHQALGTLCLCFDFEEEMKGIFKDLNHGNQHMILAVLNDAGHVISSSNINILPTTAVIPIQLELDFQFLAFKGKPYMVKAVATDGYQGFYGLTWYGMAMINIETAFYKEKNQASLDAAIIQKIQNFSSELTDIKHRSDDLLDDMKLDSVNGQIKARKFDAKAFVEVLHFVKWIGEEINDLFAQAIDNLQQTIVTSLFNEVQFRAFQGNNIADRNLYERANDVCWWALTPLFRSLLTRHKDQELTDEDRQALTTNLQYINDLYTPYLRLVLADSHGVVMATSNPPEGLKERFVQNNLPHGQALVGMQLDNALVQKAMGLPSSKSYCVSDFKPTPLYGGRPTYIYSTAVRDPHNDGRTVGVIQIVFDAEPQFQAMLADALPKDDHQNTISGSFGLFADRRKTVISSTNPDYPPGSKLSLEDPLFKHPKGARHSTVVQINSRVYALGLQVSNGYREYKQKDAYRNDVICMIFVPL